MTEKTNAPAGRHPVKIPGYQLKRVLGRGGMASVYLAVQESFGRDVAIKILSPDLARDKEFSERFLREAQIVSRLQHPNIVTVYDVGIQGGYHYLSMEYVPGKELREIKYDLPKSRIVHITREVARALDYAHKQGYIHRDVKPENIMVTENAERVVLMDFGIARMMQTDNSVTKTGKVIGTPHYMSPEQTKGVSVDHRTDIYSLGVVLFQMLAGRLPYDADSPVAVGIKHISDPIPMLPPGLEMFQNIINTCLTKSPGHRYQTAADLVAALDKLNPNAIAVLDARQSARQSKNRVVADPSAATQLGTAVVMDSETRVAEKHIDTPRSTTGKQPNFTAPPLVHPDHRKYQSGQTPITQEKEKPSGKKVWPLLLLLLVAGGGAWGYLNQPLLKDTWEQKLQPEIVQLAAKYDVTLPAFLQAGMPPVEPQKPPQEAASPNQENSQAQPAGAESVASKKPAASPAKKPNPALSDVARRLKANLKTHPEYAIRLANIYEYALKRDKANLAAQNGQAELLEWYHFEMRAALENQDLKRARLLTDQLQKSFAEEAEKPRFHRLISQLAEDELVQQHLDKAADYFNKGKLTLPAEGNALKEYREVLKLRADQPDALKGIDKIRETSLQKANHHHTRGELGEALKHVNAGLMADPRDENLRALKQSLTAHMDTVNRQKELNHEAEILFRNGNLIVPEGHSAFDIYQQVLQENPNNSRARNGMSRIQKNLVEYAEVYMKENELEKAQSLLDTAKEKFGSTPVIEETMLRLDKKIQENAPKVTVIKFSDTKPGSLSEIKTRVLKINKQVFVGIVYKQFKKPGSIIQANLLDSSGRILITSSEVTLKKTEGEQLFVLDLPTRELAEGTYKLELLHGSGRLIMGSFFNENPSN